MYMTSEPSQSQHSIIIDCSATTHMTSHPEWFKTNSFKKLIPPHRVHFGDNTTADATGIGNVWLMSKVGDKQYRICLRNTLLVPTFNVMLVSVSRLGRAGYKLIFDGCKASVACDRDAIMLAKQRKGLYHLRAHPLNQTHTAHLTMDVNVLHCCMGHIGMHRLKSMVTKGQIKDINMLTSVPKFCEACVMGKMKKLPFK
jgi:GAG-pre-integrase domain